MATATSKVKVKVHPPQPKAVVSAVWEPSTVVGLPRKHLKVIVNDGPPEYYEEWEEDGQGEAALRLLHQLFKQKAIRIKDTPAPVMKFIRKGSH